MKNFLRTFRFTLRYRWTVAASCFTALMVAALWAINIGGVYPIVEVIFRGQSLQQWSASEIQDSQQKIAEFEAQSAQLTTELAAAPHDQQPPISLKLDSVQARLASERNHLGLHEWIKPYIDRYMPADPFQTMLVVMLALTAGYIFKNVFLFFDSILVARLTALTTLDLRKKFYRRTLRMDLGSFGDARVSELMSRFTYDVDSVGQGVDTLLGRAVREPLKMVTCLVAAAWICWRLLLISVTIAPIAGFLIIRLAKMLKRANRRALEEMSGLYGALSETFGGIKVVKAFTMEPTERLRFHRATKQFFRKSMKIARYDALVSPLTEMAGISMICLTVLAGTYLVLNRETHLLGIKMCNRPISLGELLVFYGMLIGTIDPARRITDVFNRIQRGIAASDRVYDLLDREPSVRDPARPRPLVRHHRYLVFENVHFSYNIEQSVLNGIDLRIPYGETVAIIGPNGCGKTTLANLIPRFYDPTSGVIRVDDVDLREVRMRDLRRQIGLVTQEPHLFDDTVFNNIRYGTPGATRQQVIDAARKAHAHRFIEEQLEQKYDTNVGQLGGRLSGGQRQRIALARAILRDPPILILDEATSQIDVESEQLIHKVLEEFARDRTTIIITHRIATLDLADRILVMNEGRIADLGTHGELMGRCDLYRRLYQIHLRQSA